MTVFYTSDINFNFYTEYFHDNNDYVEGIISLPFLLNNCNLKNSIFVDSGNLFLNRYYFLDTNNLNLFKNLINLLNYDAVNMGDGEFTFGTKSIKFLNSNFNIPFISSNICYLGYSLENNNSSDFCHYLIKEVNDLKIGILGISDNNIFLKNFKNNLLDYDLLPLFKTLKYYTNFLKEKEKVDFIILLYRYNNFYEEKNKDSFVNINNILNEIKNIDIVISHSKNGYSRAKIVTTKKNKKVIISTIEPNLKFLGKLEVKYKKHNKKIVDFNNYFLSTKFLKKDLFNFYYKNYPKIINDLHVFLENIKTKKIFGKVFFNLFKINMKKYDNLTFLISDIIRKKVNVDIALLQKGDLYIDKIVKKSLYYQDIYDLFINNYKIVTLEIKGKDLLNFLEKHLKGDVDEYVVASGIFYYVDNNKNKIKKIIFIDKNENFNPEKYYKLCLLEKMLYNSNTYDFYNVSKNVEYTDFGIIDTVLEYFSTFIPLDEKYKYENLYENIKKYE